MDSNATCELSANIKRPALEDFDPVRPGTCERQVGCPIGEAGSWPTPKQVSAHSTEASSLSGFLDEGGGQTL